jgi:hypothetical protein
MEEALHEVDYTSPISPFVFSPSTTFEYEAVSNEVHNFFPLLFVSISCIVVCHLSLELTSFLPFSVLLSFHLQPKRGAVTTQQTETDGTTNKTKEDTIQNDKDNSNGAEAVQNKEAQPGDKLNGAEAASNEVRSFPLYFTFTSVFFMLLITEPCYLF